MTPERYQQIDRLFRLALEQPVTDRSAFIVNASEGDDELRAEVQSLLRYHDDPLVFLDDGPSPLAEELIDTEADSANISPRRQKLANGTAVGRYVVIRELGGGGMGFVYLARDPELNRKVAIKLLGVQGSRDLLQGRERLLREAQAMAQLSHPNVIAVYDVGTFAEQVFIAMEYVEGSTLAEWLSLKKRPWREVVSTFGQAGRGLAAAHAAGILHRDFKPDNVLVGSDGRVRVLDFGLARALEAAGSTEPEIADHTTSAEKGLSARAGMLAVAMTEPGKLMGTPAYMAPEQLMGQLGDARTDQFSFCVALYHGLYREPPFSGETVEALLEQMEQGRVKQSAESVPVPARFRKVLLRGLSPAREDRYESMEGLLHELTRRPPAIWQRSFGALLVLAALLAIVRFGWEKPKAEQLRSIAVLPLQNLSHDPQQEYLADGLTDEVITNLSKISSLRVIARSSVKEYKTRPRSIPEIAKDLKVDAIVQGTVLSSGDQVRITTQLIDASTQKNLRTESYEGHLGDLALQNRLVRGITTGIRVKLTPADEQRLARAQPVNADAYSAYLNGMFYYQKSWQKEDTEAAIGMFERSTTLDPEFALAYARLADAYLYTYRRFDSSQEVGAKAFVATQKSLSLDPNLAEAHFAQGQVASLIHDSPPETAVKDFRRALELNPNLPEAHFSLGGVYLHVGLLDEALSELNAALALDPHNFRFRYYIARVHLYQQRYDEAFLDYKRSPDFKPELLWERALILFYRGEKPAARELIVDLHQKLPANEDIASTYAVLLAAEGEKEQAEEQIRLAIRTGEGRRHFHHAEYNIASAYALMNNRPEALQWLRKTAEHHLTCYPLFERDPNLNNLRGDPDFKIWLGEMKTLWERRRARL